MKKNTKFELAMMLNDILNQVNSIGVRFDLEMIYRKDGDKTYLCFSESEIDEGEENDQD